MRDGAYTNLNIHDHMIISYDVIYNDQSKCTWSYKTFKGPSSHSHEHLKTQMDCIE